MYITTINKRGHEFKRNQEDTWKGLEGIKGRKKLSNYILSSQIKKKIKNVNTNNFFNIREYFLNHKYSLLLK